METKYQKEYDYALGRLDKAVRQCDDSALKWVMISIRNNEKAFCEGEIAEDKRVEQQHKVSGLILDFSRDCNCHYKKYMSPTSVR